MEVYVTEVYLKKVWRNRKRPKQWGVEIIELKPTLRSANNFFFYYKNVSYIVSLTVDSEAGTVSSTCQKKLNGSLVPAPEIIEYNIRAVATTHAPFVPTGPSC